MSGTGVWLAGARGSVATTAVLGALAVRAGLADRTGFVCEAPGFPDAGLPTVGDLVFGGHDLADVPPWKRAEQLADADVVPPGLPARLRGELAAVEADIVTGGADGRTRDPAGTLRRLADDIRAFRDRHGLERVVVVNVTATEPPTAPLDALGAELGEAALPLLHDALRTNDTRLVAAALGPYGAARLPAPAWRQAVLKCVFTGVPLSVVAGLDDRADAELTRMMTDYARERTAAGRDVPADVARFLEVR
jgi:myo-inositol-1-phosphate synthase